MTPPRDDRPRGKGGRGPWKGPRRDGPGGGSSGGFGRGDRPFSKGPRREGPGGGPAGGFGRGDRPFNKGPRRDGPGGGPGGGFNRGDRPFSKGPRREGPGGGFGRGDRPFSKGPRREGPGGGFNRGDRPFSKGPRREGGPGGGFNRGDRPFSKGPRREGGPGGGFNRGDRPFNKGPRREGPGGGFNQGGRPFDKGPRREGGWGGGYAPGEHPFDKAGRPEEPSSFKPDFSPPAPAEAGPPAEDFVFGRHPVLELLKAEGDCRVNKLWLVKGGGGSGFEELLSIARGRRIVFQWVERDRLDEMVRSANHQGVVARVTEVGYGSWEDLFKTGTPSPLVLLDGIEDPYNVGAIVRSAAFFGGAAVVVPRWRSAGLSGAVMKASAGALVKVPLVQVTNIAQSILDLKEKGYWVYGAEGGAEAQPLPAVQMNTPFALVIGAEGTGLHRLVKERCHGLVSVPGSGRMESLNASCAAATLLHEVFRREKPAP